jgi:hypothetical protein
MKEHLTEWLRQKPSVGGVLVRGIRFPDRTFFCDFDSRDFPMAALEEVWRCVDDAFQLLNARQSPPLRLTWVYERAILHCARHEDGAILGVFVQRDLKQVEQAGVDQLLSEFRAEKLTC